MVWVNNQRTNAEAELNAVKTIHTTDPNLVLHSMKQFISENFPAGQLPDLLLTGENGDERLNAYYESVESGFKESIPVARFKDLCGEYCTAFPSLSGSPCRSCRALYRRL